MLTRAARRRILFALVAITLVGGLSVSIVVLADVYAHWRTQDVAGVNIWGYRGAPLEAKRAGEVRVAIIGGSTAFGWGLPANESIPAFLARRLNASQRKDGRRFTVANLGAPRQGAYGFLYDLRDYAYLDYDVVCLYEGYNDLGATAKDLGDLLALTEINYTLWRRDSPIFRATGYYPILPLILFEKSEILLHGRGNQDAVTFRPGMAARTTGSALRAAAEISAKLSARLGGLSKTPVPVRVAGDCVVPWKHYCGAVEQAVAWALANNKKVLFVTQPYISDSHIEQQANVEAMLRTQFGGDSRLRYLNLGRAVDLHDRSIAYDGLHLVARGNDTVASQLVDPVLELAR